MQYRLLKLSDNHPSHAAFQIEDSLEPSTFSLFELLSDPFVTEAVHKSYLDYWPPSSSENETADIICFICHCNCVHRSLIPHDSVSNANSAIDPRAPRT